MNFKIFYLLNTSKWEPESYQYNIIYVILERVRFSEKIIKWHSFKGGNPSKKTNLIHIADCEMYNNNNNNKKNT